MIFEWVTHEGLSAHGVVKRLTNMKIPTRSGNTKWARSTVLRIIKNETYCGVTYYNKHKVTHLPENIPLLNNGELNTGKKHKISCHQRAKEKWIPIPLPEECHIISRETWELAQKQLQKNTVFSPRNTKHNYLLQGLVRCNNCHSPFTGQVSKRSHVYRCGNRHKRFPLPRNCFVRSANKEILENLVWKSVVSAIQNPNLLKEQIDRLKKKYSDTSGMQLELIKIEQFLEKKQKEESRLIDALQAGVLTLDQIKPKLDRLGKEKERIQNEKNEIESKMQRTTFTSIDSWSIEQWCHAMKNRVTSMKFEEKQAILRHLLNGIFVDDTKVIIKGEIPFPPANTDTDERENPANHKVSVPEIVPTLLVQRGRNTTQYLPFEIVKPLPRKVNQFKPIVPQL
jgi:site-specific DNA recombinase